MNLFELDKSNMRDVILNFPKQFAEGIKAARGVGFQHTTYNVQHTVISGMGGSALPGELLKLLSAHLNWPIGVNIHRNYGLPHGLSLRGESGANDVAIHKIASSSDCNRSPHNDVLIICISFSGNTEETLSTYKEAKKLNLPVAVITTGGELARAAEKDNTPLALITPRANIQPRAAIGYQLSALLKILSNAKIIKSQDKGLLSLEKSLAPINLELEGRELAKKLKGKTPLIYTSQNYKALAYIWKIKFNENSKIHAFCNYFPELNHNEMVGYADFAQISDLDAKSSTLRSSKMRRRAPSFHTIILRADDDHPRIQKRMNLTADIIKKRGYGVDILDIKSDSVYNSMFNSILLADWTSYYLALEYGIDPTPVDIVEEFKKKL